MRGESKHTRNNQSNGGAKRKKARLLAVVGGLSRGGGEVLCAGVRKYWQGLFLGVILGKRSWMEKWSRSTERERETEIVGKRVLKDKFFKFVQ